MQKETQKALLVAAAGFALNKFEGSKINVNKPALTQNEDLLRQAGRLATFLGLTSAVILEATKNSPKARKVSFIGLTGVTIGGFIILMYALKKMT